MHGKTPVSSFKSSKIPPGKLGPVTKRQCIKLLVDHMFDVEWFNNFNTHGTYCEIDFKEDLMNMELSELKALRQYQVENLSDELFYEHVWNGETIVYHEFETS